MIQKIKPSDYLPRIDAMTAQERKAHEARVGEWLASGGQRLVELTDRPMAKAQNIVLMSARMTKEDCQAFQEGARLLTAYIDTRETWLPTQLYARSAYRAVRQMVFTLAPEGVQVRGKADGLTQSALIRQDPVLGGDTIAGQQTKKTLPMIRETGRSYDPKTNTVRVQMEATPGVYRPNTPAGTNRTVIASKQNGDFSQSPRRVPANSTQGAAGKPAGTVAAVTPFAPDGKVPPRPTHFDQYVHLLSQAAQELAAEYGPTKREMEESRQKLALLLDDTHASANDRQTWATHITKLDNKLKKITDRVDAEWAELVKQGRVVMDDLGMAHVVDVAADAGGGDGIAENAKKDDAEKQAAKEKREQIKALRCWIRDCRTAPKNQKHLKHWREKYLEMIALGGTDTVTDAVREAAKFYGFDLNALNKEVLEVKSEE